MKKVNFLQFYYIYVDDVHGYKTIEVIPRHEYTNYILFDINNFPLKMNCRNIYYNQPKDIIDLYAIPSIEKHPGSSQD